MTHKSFSHEMKEKSITILFLAKSTQPQITVYKIISIKLDYVNCCTVKLLLHTKFISFFKKNLAFNNFIVIFFKIILVNNDRV